MLVGTVAALWRYPVKSLRGEELSFAPIGPHGIRGDRGVAIVDQDSGRVISSKRVHQLMSARAVARPGGPVLCLPDGSVIPFEAPEAAALVSEWLGRPVRLEVAPGGATESVIESEGAREFRSRPGGFHDGHEIHLLTTATLMYLKSLHPDGDWDPRRFRPNVVIDATGDGPVEQTWIGRALRIGDVELHVTEPCSRCVMTTLPQDELAHDPAILATVAREQDNNVGVVATVRAPGSVAVGDDVQVVI